MHHAVSSQRRIMSQEAFQRKLIAFNPNRKELSWWFDSYSRVWPGNYYCRQLLPNFFNRPSGVPNLRHDFRSPYLRFLVQRTNKNMTTALNWAITQRVVVIHYRRFGYNPSVPSSRAKNPRGSIVCLGTTRRSLLLGPRIQEDRWFVSGQPVGPIFKGR